MSCLWRAAAVVDSEQTEDLPIIFFTLPIFMSSWINGFIGVLKFFNKSPTFNLLKEDTTGLLSQF